MLRLHRPSDDAACCARLCRKCTSEVSALRGDSLSVSDWSIANPESAGTSQRAASQVGRVAGRRPSQHPQRSCRAARQAVIRALSRRRRRVWGEPLGNVAHGPDSKHDLRSVTKSVISLLLGIALDRKLINGIDDSVISFFPQYPDLHTPQKERITLRHLLTMSAGLEWNENVPFSDPKNSAMRMLSSADRCRYVLEQPVAVPAGQVWNYNSGGTLLLEAVIANAAGGALDDVAREFCSSLSVSPTSNGRGI